MNKNTGYVLRIALGGYLIWLGINILIQVLDARPTNTEFVCAAAVFFIGVGGVYAVYSLIKLLSMKIKLRKKAVSEDESINETAEGVPSARHQPEKRTHQLTQAVIKLPADTVEFPRMNKSAETKPGENTQPDKGGIEKTISLRTEEIKEIAKAEEEKATKDADFAKAEAEVVELSDGEELQEIEEIETDYEEK